MRLFCKSLAACLCMKQPTSPALELLRKKRLSIDIANPDNDDPSSMSENESTTNKLLKRMCDQLNETRANLETPVHNEQPLYESDKENEMKDWMLAAAVFNRISAIVFTIVLVGGTLVFFVLLFCCSPVILFSRPAILFCIFTCWTAPPDIQTIYTLIAVLRTATHVFASCKSSHSYLIQRWSLLVANKLDDFWNKWSETLTVIRWIFWRVFCLILDMTVGC